MLLHKFTSIYKPFCSLKLIMIIQLYNNKIYVWILMTYNIDNKILTNTLRFNKMEHFFENVAYFRLYIRLQIAY